VNPPYLYATPLNLVDHPQLAMVQALENVLWLAKMALLAEHPDLLETDRDPMAGTVDPRSFAADQILITADALQRLLKFYRQALGTRADPADSLEQYDFLF
jgi:hypothetical protein